MQFLPQQSKVLGAHVVAQVQVVGMDIEGRGVPLYADASVVDGTMQTVQLRFGIALDKYPSGPNALEVCDRLPRTQFHADGGGLSRKRHAADLGDMCHQIRDPQVNLRVNRDWHVDRGPEGLWLIGVWFDLIVAFPGSGSGDLLLSGRENRTFLRAGGV